MFNISAATNYTNSANKYAYNIVEMTLILITLTAFSATSIFGNVLVFVAYYQKKYLQKSTNYFILSLASVDLFISVFSVNIFSMYVVLGYWPYEVLNYATCVSWLAFDYWFFQVSVYSVLLIAGDRYLSIIYPYTYPYKRTEFRIKCVIAINWITSFIIWVPIIIAYSSKEFQREAIENKICDVGSANDVIPTVIGSTLSYVIPIFIMVFFALHSVHVLMNMNQWSEKQCGKLNATIIRSDKEIEESDKKSKCSRRKSKPVDINKKVIVRKSNEIIKESSLTISIGDEDMMGNANNSSNIRGNYNGSFENDIECSTNQLAISTLASVSRLDMIEKNECKDKSKPKVTLSYLQRIATFNLILATTFLVNLLPFGILSVIRASCNNCISNELWIFGYTMGYLNSLLNPMCYGFGNKNFKRAFRSILRLKKGD